MEKNNRRGEGAEGANRDAMTSKGEKGTEERLNVAPPPDG